MTTLHMSARQFTLARRTDRVDIISPDLLLTYDMRTVISFLKREYWAGSLKEGFVWTKLGREALAEFSHAPIERTSRSLKIPEYVLHFKSRRLAVIKRRAA